MNQIWRWPKVTCLETLDTKGSYRINAHILAPKGSFVGSSGRAKTVITSPIQTVDLRSDTVTLPCQMMREAMARAEVGDDMVGEDPTTNLLQREVADYFGFEEGLFVPSGTMSNQIAIKTHTQPGDEILCDETSHIYTWEAGGPAFLSGVTCRTLHAENGVIGLKHVDGMIRPGNLHYVSTRLVIVENTHNRGGGAVHPIDSIAELRDWTRKNGLILHCDGARIWNAIIASGISGREWASHLDSLSVCFSKGLGAPVGSMLLGSEAFIRRARKFRKIFGGAMRQAGVLAAGAHYAFRNNIQRLKEDHQNATRIANTIRETPGLLLESPKPETNLIWFQVDPKVATGNDLASKLKGEGVLVSQAGPQVCRAVTHLDATGAKIEFACAAIRKVGKMLQDGRK